MTHSHRRGNDVEREARRRRVSSLLLAGITDQKAIAEQVGASQPTISRDIKAIEQMWQADAVQDIAAAKGKSLGRIERAIAGLWPKVRSGDERAISQLVSLLQLEAKLLGLNAPESQNLNVGGDGLKIQIERVNREPS